MANRRYFVALVEDFIDGGYFVTNSRDDKMFFENWIQSNNRKFYSIIFKMITVDEEDVDKTVEYLENVSKVNVDAGVRERVKRAWFMFDFNFKHCTEEEKNQMITSYDLHDE